jgi:hypothetical protein
MKRTFQSLTEAQLDLLRDTNLSATQIAEALDCGLASISRWRSKLGVKTPMGCKKGISYDRSHLRKRETRKCAKPDCNNEFECCPSERKKYCSLSCGAYCNTGKGAKLKETTPAYKKYAGKVHRLTQKIYEQYKDEINPDNLPRTLCGVEDGYQLDHIIPIKFGFENDIPREVLADKDNLRMLPWKENLIRNYLES